MQGDCSEKARAYVEALEPSFVNDILSGSRCQYARIFKRTAKEMPMTDFGCGFDASSCSDADLPATVSGLIAAMRENREMAVSKILAEAGIGADGPITKDAVLAAHKNLAAEFESMLLVSPSELDAAFALHEADELGGLKPFIYDYADSGWAVVPADRFVWNEKPLALTVEAEMVKALDKFGFSDGASS